MSTLTEEQYRDDSNLAARSRLHARYARINWFEWVVVRMALPDRSSVLDTGCGAAWFWCSRAPDGLDIDLTLCDQSAGMVAAAARNIGNLEWTGGVRTQIADLQKLPFEDRTFDRVIAMHMLYHLPDPEIGIMELKRVLKPGGRAFISTNGMDHMRELHALAATAYGASSTDPGAVAFSIDQAEMVMKRHFADVVVHRCNDVLDCTEPDDIKDYLLSMPPGDGLDNQQVAALELTIAKEFDAGGGRFLISKQAALIEGTKLP
ncbi:MAG: methyltransferase domain-containing protein [Hyphomicrobiales bacterium]|nr:methyltransferase domain-containing protein [Hyphomicrobiales bacterium]MCP5000148.1 methyltransferase domain-containing protein [Hyphomicrobiales bacterium]